MQLLKEDFIKHAKKYYDEALKTLVDLLKYPTVLDEYERFNIDKPMSNDTLDEFELDNNFQDTESSPQGEAFLNSRLRERH